MNTFNRIVLVLLVLLAMVICSLVLVVPIETLEVIAQQARGLADTLSRIRAVVRLPVGILLALIVDLIGILLIVLELRRRRVETINVEQAEGGQVTLSVASIADQLQAEIKQLPEVLQARPTVSAKRKGVVVELDAKVAAESDVPGKAQRIVETIRQVVEEKMGLRLARPPKLNIEAVRRGPEARRIMTERTRPTVEPLETPDTSEDTSDEEYEVS